jgi:hypothetical protein
MSGVSSPLLIFLMASPKGKIVFSPSYRETIRQTPQMRSGCAGSLPAVLIVPAMFASYLVFLMTGLSVLVLLGLIRSV